MHTKHSMILYGFPCTRQPTHGVHHAFTQAEPSPLISLVGEKPGREPTPIEAQHSSPSTMKRIQDSLRENRDTCHMLDVLREKITYLSAREADVRTEVENAELQPGKRRRVAHWLNNVEAKKDEVQSIENMSQQQATSSNSQLFRHIEKNIKDVQELIQQGRFPDGLVLDDPSSGMAGEMFHQHFETIIGWLKISKPFIIGIYGKGGVGKTLLLKCIYNHLQSNSDVAENIYWVTASCDCSMYKLQHKILCGVTGLNDFDEDIEKRAEILHKVLTKTGRKTVIILDDFWETCMLDEIGIPVRESSCRIILSSRSLEVCRGTGCSDFTIEIKPLSTDEAWCLFVNKLQNYEELAPEVKPTVKLVAEECQCLPLVVLTVAVSMSGVFDMAEWENALNELRNPIRRRQYNPNDDMFDKLKFSYDRLNDEMLQTCLLSCVLYPEGTDIERKELIELWIAEGLLKDMGSWQEQLNKGHTILNKLENSCLLERSIDPWFSNICVKMHDRIRDMCIIITRSHPGFMAKSGLFLNKVPPEEQWNEDLVKVSLRENNIEDITMHKPPMCKTLSVLLLCRNPLKGIPESFFGHMRAVTVLDLSYTLLQTLPDSISGLENLSALFLFCCEELIHVPSLSKLTKLTVLDLAFCRKLREAPRGIENLTCLKKLNCLWNLNDLSYFHMLRDCQHFYKLSCYEFWIHGSSNAEPYCIESDRLKTDSTWDFDRRVIISGEEIGPTLSTILLPVTTRFLSIMNCDMNGNGSTLGDKLPSLNRVTELKSLKIADCRGLEYISSINDRFSSGFDKLGTLECIEFWKCDLKSLIEFSQDSKPKPLLLSPSPSRQLADAFYQLKKLRIQECHNLKAVFPFKLLQHQPCFPNLEDINVIICQEVEEIFEANGLDDVNLVLKLPKLRSISIGHLPKLCSIYKGLICTPLHSLCSMGDTPNFGRIHRGPCLFWDDSVYSMAFDSNSHVWNLLFRDYPEDAVVFSSWVNHRHYSSLIEWIDSVEEDC